MKILKKQNYEEYFRIIKENQLEDLIEFSKTVKVLYVDSDLGSIDDSYGIFKIFFHDIDIAHNALEGLQKFEQNKYDLIITSPDMPKMNGVEMITKIRQISRHITILILSSKQCHFIDLIRLGIDGYILKPVEVEQFTNIIQKVIEKLENKQGLYEYRINLEQKIKEKTQELQSLNKILEEKFKKELEINKLHEKHIHEQTQLASMGEMISNIAHQWRQPLSVISTVATGLEFKINMDRFNTNEAKKDLHYLNHAAQHLSETIDTFRDFMINNKKSKEVILQSRIDKALNLVEAPLKTNHIKLINDIDYSKPIKVNLILGELSQVIINIIYNAKDALLENNISDPWIKVATEKSAQKIVLTVEDNAGGIKDDILPRIFEPYFTTKHQSQGTGLGLYMSYKIMKESLNGDIYVENTVNGAKFYIEIPLL